MQECEMILLMRIPLSDGAKVTLATMVLYHNRIGDFPRIAELARMRIVTDEGIRKHLAEIIKAGYLCKEQGEDAAVYELDWKALANAMGFKNKRSFDPDAAVRAHVGKSSTPEDVIASMSEPTKFSQVGPYFRFLCQDRRRVKVLVSTREQNALKAMAREFGIALLVKIVKYYVKYSTRLSLGPLSVDTMFAHKKRLHKAVEVRRSKNAKRL